MAKSMEAIISLAGKVDPSLSKAIDSVEKKLSGMKKLGKVGQTVGKVGVAAAKGIAVAAGAASTALAAIGTAAVTSYADYEQMIGGVEALFGDQAAKTVAENAANAFKTAGVSANSYMEQATSFSASLIQNLGGDTQKAAQYADLAIKDMSDNSNRMGTSIESIQQTYQSLMRGNYAMLDNLKLGYGGTKTELERLVKDANEYKESIGEVGDLSSDNFADVIQAINAIQRKIGITGTTAAEAMETIQGSVNMAKAAWDNWLTGLGRTDADMGALTDQLLESVGAVASNVGPVVGRIGQALATALPDALAGAWNMAVGALGGMGIQLPTIDASQITAVFQPLADMASTVGPYIAQFAQTVLPAIGSALGPIVQLLASIVSTVLPPLLAVLGPVISVLMQLVSAILPPLAAVISALLPPIMSIVQAVLPPLMSLIMTLMPIIQQIATVIGGILISAIQMLAPIVMQIFSIGMNLLNSVIIPLLSPIMQLAQMLLPQLMAAWNMLQGPINVIIGLFGSVLGVVNSVVSAIGSLIGKIGEAASALANSPIGQAVGAVGSFLGFARGGFTSGPYIAGEDPRYPNEAVISFNPAYRAQNLRYWQMAGHMLGASPSVQAATSTGGGTSISVGGITFAPNITVRGNASKDDFVAALREVEPDFVDFVVDAIARRTEAAYAL